MWYGVVRYYSHMNFPFWPGIRKNARHAIFPSYYGSVWFRMINTCFRSPRLPLTCASVHRKKAQQAKLYLAFKALAKLGNFGNVQVFLISFVDFGHGYVAYTIQLYIVTRTSDNWIPFSMRNEKKKPDCTQNRCSDEAITFGLHWYGDWLSVDKS